MVVEIHESRTGEAKQCSGKDDKERKVVALLEANRMVYFPDCLDPSLSGSRVRVVCVPFRTWIWVVHVCVSEEEYVDG